MKEIFPSPDMPQVCPKMANLMALRTAAMLIVEVNSPTTHGPEGPKTRHLRTGCQQPGFPSRILLYMSNSHLASSIWA